MISIVTKNKFSPTKEKKKICFAPQTGGFWVKYGKKGKKDQIKTHNMTILRDAPHILSIVIFIMKMKIITMTMTMTMTVMTVIHFFIVVKLINDLNNNNKKKMNNFKLTLKYNILNLNFNRLNLNVNRLNLNFDKTTLSTIVFFAISSWCATRGLSHSAASSPFGASVKEASAASSTIAI